MIRVSALHLPLKLQPVHLFIISVQNDDTESLKYFWIILKGI